MVVPHLTVQHLIGQCDGDLTHRDGVARRCDEELLLLKIAKYDLSRRQKLLRQRNRACVRSFMGPNSCNGPAAFWRPRKAINVGFRVFDWSGDSNSSNRSNSRE